MAGGKLTPRQKMINLMYLVFIAMLALNMSKEVLSAFGLMNEKFSSENKTMTEQNNMLYGALKDKAAEDAANFKEAKDKADKVKKASDAFYKVLDTKRKEAEGKFERNEDGSLPYESMDKSTVDELWFQGDGYSKSGKEIIAAFDAYKKEMKTVLTGKDFKEIVKEIDVKFNTNDVKDGEGVTKKYLDYHYKGFPAIATVTKINALQNDIKAIEADVYNQFMGNTFKAAASYSNYQAMVISEKSAYFAGEEFKGKVVLGRYDDSTVPTSVTVNGTKVDLSKALDDGQVKLNFKTGNVGEHDIKGSFTFTEEGKPIDIPIIGNYVVVPKPNSATISADKMNVVYRGIPNPMTISFAGVSSDKVNASAPGLSKAGKAGAYTITPQGGKEVTINVVGTLEDGQKVSDKKVFRIKNIPAPTGKIRGESDAKGPKSSLTKSTVSAVLEDFDFPVKVVVKSFALKVPGQPTIIVAGNRMNGKAQAAIKRAKRGDLIVISNIKVKYQGINQVAKNVSSCTYEIQ